MAFDFTQTKIHHLSHGLAASTRVTPEHVDLLLTELEDPAVQGHLGLISPVVGVAYFLEALSTLVNKRVALSRDDSEWKIRTDISPLKLVCRKETHCAGDDTAHRNGANTGCCKMTTHGNKDMWKTGLVNDAETWRSTRGLPTTAEIVFFTNTGTPELFLTDDI